MHGFWDRPRGSNSNSSNNKIGLDHNNNNNNNYSLIELLLHNAVIVETLIVTTCTVL